MSIELETPEISLTEQDEDDEELASGEHGEIVSFFSMPIAMLFSDNDELTQEVFSRLLRSS